MNARGTFLCYKYAAAQMIIQGRGGRIIGPSSRNGKKGVSCPGPEWFRTTLINPGMPDGIAYSSTKFAIRGLTQAAGEFRIFHPPWILVISMTRPFRSIGAGASQNHREHVCARRDRHTHEYVAFISVRSMGMCNINRYHEKKVHRTRAERAMNPHANRDRPVRALMRSRP